MAPVLLVAPARAAAHRSHPEKNKSQRVPTSAAGWTTSQKNFDSILFPPLRVVVECRAQEDRGGDAEQGEQIANNRPPLRRKNSFHEQRRTSVRGSGSFSIIAYFKQNVKMCVRCRALL